jgi:hypothetical protein
MHAQLYLYANNLQEGRQKMCNMIQLVTIEAFADLRLDQTSNFLAPFCDHEVQALLVFRILSTTQQQQIQLI